MKNEDLSWWDWLTLTPTALKFRGVDPQLRFRETGHIQALSPRWARTVGMWRVNTSAEIREAAGVSDNAVRVFKHKNVLRVVALSGGYSRDDANKRLARNNGMTASFSRALAEGLTAQQSDAEFDSMLDSSIESIYRASIT